MNKLSDVKVEDSSLLQKGYNAKDLLGRTFTVESIDEKIGDNGPYLIAKISGTDIESDKTFTTGATNIVARLSAAKEQNLLPVEVTIVKLGANAYDVM